MGSSVLQELQRKGVFLREDLAVQRHPTQVNSKPVQSRSGSKGKPGVKLVLGGD
uniref:Uncharacterized protein n=1 Tax=Arundo donax TaxID=35708 RepID=A0A0A9F3S7_ARUDO